MQLPYNKIVNSFKQSKYLELLLPSLKQEKTQKFTSVVLTFFALSIFGIFAINPTISTIARLQRELEDNKFTEAQLTQKINNLSALGRQYQQIQDDIPFVLASLPQEPQISLLAAQIQSLAKDAGVTLNGLQTYQVEVTTPKNSKKKYSSFTFSLAVEGSYNDVLALVDSIATMQRIVSLDNIAINRKSDQSGLTQLSIKGTAYFKN